MSEDQNEVQIAHYRAEYFMHNHNEIIWLPKNAAPLPGQNKDSGAPSQDKAGQITDKVDLCPIFDITKNMGQERLNGAISFIHKFLGKTGKLGPLDKASVVPFNLDTIFSFGSMIIPYSADLGEPLVKNKSGENRIKSFENLQISEEAVPNFVTLINFIKSSLENTPYLKTCFMLFTASCHGMIGDEDYTNPANVGGFSVEGQKEFFTAISRLVNSSMKRQFKLAIVHLGQDVCDPVLYYRLSTLSPYKSALWHYPGNEPKPTIGQMNKLLKFSRPVYHFANNAHTRVSTFVDFCGKTFYITKDLRGKFSLINLLADKSWNFRLNQPTEGCEKSQEYEEISLAANLYLIEQNIQYIMLNIYKVPKPIISLKSLLQLIKDKYLDLPRQYENRPKDIDRIYRRAKICYDFVSYYIGQIKDIKEMPSWKYLDLMCKAHIALIENNNI